MTERQTEEHLVRCACGWERRGPLEEIVAAALEHGRTVHNMEATREQVLATVTRV